MKAKLTDIPVGGPVRVFHVDRKWLTSLPVRKPHVPSAALVRHDRDARG